MSDATVKLRNDYSAKKAALEAERDSFMQQANAHIAELKRPLDEYTAQAQTTLNVLTRHIGDMDEFLKWVDAHEAEEAAKEAARQQPTEGAATPTPPEPPAQDGAAGSPDTLGTH